MICIDCIEEHHDDHLVRNLKKYLKGEIETKLAKPFKEGIAECKKILEQIIQSTASELERCRLESQTIESQLTHLSHHNELLDHYDEVSRSSVLGLIARETKLLVKNIRN